MNAATLTIAPDLEQVLSPMRVPFDRMLSAFERAEHLAGGAHVFRFKVARMPVVVRVVGDAWAELVGQALGHLPAADESREALEICVWDVAETGVTPTGPHPDLDAPPIVLKTSADGRYVGEDRPHASMWQDRETQRIVGFSAGVDTLTLDERARPFHKMLCAWMIERGVQFVHAGLVAVDDTAVMLVGNGGAGKSTSSIASLLGGLEYLGDDFVGISSTGRNFVGHGFYASCLLDSGHLRRFPALRSMARPPNHEYEHKHVMYLRQAFSERLVEERPLRALLLPRVVDAVDTTFEKASPLEALRAMAPTSVMYLPRPSRAAFERLTDLVEAVPAYWLNLGRDVGQIPGAVRALIATL